MSPRTPRPAPEEEERTSVDPPLALREPLDGDAASERSPDAGIETVLVPCDPTATHPNTAWHLVQLWTRGRIYGLDRDYRCVAVIDRKTGHDDPRHLLLGARLKGGQRVTGRDVVLVHPLPVPGTNGIFETRTGAGGRTSVIERVLVRLPAVRLPQAQAGAGWSAVTARLRGRRAAGG